MKAAQPSTPPDSSVVHVVVVPHVSTAPGTSQLSRGTGGYYVLQHWHIYDEIKQKHPYEMCV